MNPLKNIYYVLFIQILFSRIAAAQILTELTKIQVAGIKEITANNLSQTDSVNWVVSSYFIDEDDYSFEKSPDTLSAKGDSIRVLFTKKVGKYTFYKIFAGNNAFFDSVTVQVLDKGIPERYLFQNISIPDKPIVFFVILPTDIENADFIMVMHGLDRNSLDYIQAWKNFGENNNYVCAAPTFSSADWPGSISYNLGNMFNSTNYNLLNPDSVWSFTLISKIHDELVEALGMKNEQYDIWGHSAGAQFVHRLMTFKPDYKIQHAIAANAGWYTLPDFDIDYPFGLKNDNLIFDETFTEDLVIKPLVIMRGTADTIRDGNLNTSTEADAQGKNRYERAGTYFSYANQIDVQHKWKLIDVENVGHDYVSMAKAAQNFLLNPTNVDDAEPVVINGFQLYQNYPNPFNPTTTIRISIPRSSDGLNNRVSLIVYNSLGEEVTVLLEDEQISGNASVIFNGKDKNGNPLSSGIYFYRLSVGKHSAVNKMVLLK